MKVLEIDQNQDRKAFWTFRKKKEKNTPWFQKYSQDRAVCVRKLGVHIVGPGAALLSAP